MSVNYSFEIIGVYYLRCIGERIYFFVRKKSESSSVRSANSCGKCVVCEVVFAKAVSNLISKGYFVKENIVELSLVFTDSHRIETLNFEYRGIDKPTNVLSFPTAFASSDGCSSLMLGDIVLAYEIIEIEANVLGKEFENHLVHLIIHGFLHLLGYDHVDDKDACVMEGLERSILEDLGINDPYEVD